MPIESASDGFEEWVETVRDPAVKASEGKRVIRAGKDAEASYEIAPLPDDRWAVKVKYAYHCGNVSGLGTPWCAFPTREECLAYFLDGARHHFRKEPYLTGAQQKSQKKMASLLGTTLLFVEPRVEPPDPKEAERKKTLEESLRAQRAEARRKLKADLPLFANLIGEEE